MEKYDWNSVFKNYSYKPFASKQELNAYLDEVEKTKQELKRVSWPTKKELLKNTGVVLTVVTSATILVWALDTGLQGALGLILKQTKRRKQYVRITRSKMVCCAYLFRA